MAEIDSENQLLDGIAGEDSDCDFGNADEDALLDDSVFDNTDFIEAKSSYVENEDHEELDHEPDSEDVLDLLVQDTELEEEDERTNFNQTINSTITEDHERDTDKFKNERLEGATKSFRDIPDSLDEVAFTNTRRNGKKYRQQKFRKNNFVNQMQGRNYLNPKSTVHINPHFKGQVRINNNARLAWDARQKMHSKRKMGKVTPFVRNDKRQLHAVPVNPWLTNNQIQHVPPQHQPFQQPSQTFLQSHQISWTRPPPNQFIRQMPPQIAMNNNQPQHCFMQPLPQQPTIIHQPFPQQPPQPISVQFTPPPAPTVVPYNNQFIPPPNQYPINQNPIPPQNQYNINQNPNFNPGYNQPTIFNQPLPSNPQFILPEPEPLVQQYQQYNKPIFIPPNQSTVQYQNRKQYPPNHFNQKPVNVYNKKVNPTRKKIENFDARKKKRPLVINNNLQQVHTVELPDTTVNDVKIEKPNLEEEDEEMKAYRLKIEEQKRKREAIIKAKEARRREAALTKLNEAPSSSSNTVQPNSSLISNKQLKPMVTIRNNITTNTNKQLVSTQNAPIRKIVLNPKSNSNTKILRTPQENTEVDHDKQHLASFLSNRKILATDQHLINTDIVMVNNLADSTSAIKLRKMCQGIGDVKKLQMSPKERQATIQFNSVASAHAFFKKYQRTMLDLSMIQVTLKPIS